MPRDIVVYTSGSVLNRFRFKPHYVLLHVYGPKSSFLYAQFNARCSRDARNSIYKLNSI